MGMGPRQLGGVESGLALGARGAARQLLGYDSWRDSTIGNGGSYDDYLVWLGQRGGLAGFEDVASLGRQGTRLGQVQLPPGATPTPMPYQPPVPQQLPQGQASFAPPAVAMPQMLPNPTPQGLGGMPLVRDRMMSQVMAPFAQPNWGVPQVPPQYLTQQMPLPGGSVTGIPVTMPDTRDGRMSIPRQPPRGTAA